MKIFTLSSSLLDEAQGSGYVVMGYVRRLRERGHEVDVVGPRELLDLDRGSRALRYRQMLAMATQSIARLGQGYQIFEYYGGEAWLAIEILRRLKRRPLLVAHSNGLEPFAARLASAANSTLEAQSRKWTRPELVGLLARSFTGSDALVTVSNFDREFALENAYKPGDRVLAIDNPLPDSFLNQPLVHERPPRIVFCGSWIARKGIEVLCNDVRKFLETRTDWNLTLVGVGPGVRVADYFPESIATRVDVVPHTDREGDLKRIYLGSRIAIQSSVYESFGLAAAEAMSCGCALVASRVGFAASLVDGQEALLFRSTGNPSLAECLMTLAGNEQLRRHIAANGHGRVQNLRWSSAAERLERAYLSWIEEHRHSQLG